MGMGMLIAFVLIPYRSDLTVVYIIHYSWCHTIMVDWVVVMKLKSMNVNFEGFL